MSRGFTLLEVLVAVAVLAISAVAILSVFGLGTQATGRDQIAAARTALANELLAETRARPYALPQLARGVSGNGDLRWEIRADPVESATHATVSSGSLQSVTILVGEVSAKEDAMAVQAHFLHFGPAEPQP